MQVDDETILEQFLKRNYSITSIEHRVYEIALKYTEMFKDISLIAPYRNSISALSTELLDSANQEIRILEARCLEYSKEITELSQRFTEADEIVNDEIKSKEKIKQFSSELRIENSNLILVNRTLRRKLAEYGIQMEENDKIVKKLNSFESVKERGEMPCIALMRQHNDLPRVDSDREQSKFREMSSDSSFSLSLSYSQRSSAVKLRTMSIEQSSYIQICPSFNTILEKSSILPVRIKDIKLIREQYRGLSKEFQTTISIFQKNAHNYPKKTLIISECSYLSTPRVKKSLIVACLNTISLNSQSDKQARLRYINSSITISPMTYRKNKEKRFIDNNEIVTESSYSIIGKVHISLSQFQIFAVDKGRSVVEPVEISDEEEEMMSKYLSLSKPKLSLTRFPSSSYKPVRKVLAIRGQKPVKITPPAKKFKIELILSAGIFPKKPQLLLSMYKVLSISLAAEKRRNIPEESRKKQSFDLEIEECESFSIIQSIQILEDIEDPSQRGKKSKRPAKRISAIEEYFTLVRIT